MAQFFTATGQVVGFGEGEFTVASVHLEDIILHLSRINRFGGAGQRFYSVLKHSLMVADLVPPAMRHMALLHDAAEAYLGDVVTPLKAHLPGLTTIEERFRSTIFQALGVPLPSPEQSQALHQADARAFGVEAFLFGPPGLWEALGSPRDENDERLLREMLERSCETCRDQFEQAFGQLEIYGKASVENRA
jgi:hypothetical protein